MPAVWVRFRVELRTRWKSVVILTVLVAVGSATVLTAAAGARRAATTVDRFLAETRTLDALVQAGTPERPADPALFDAIEQLPGVETIGRIAFYLVFSSEHGFVPLSASVDGREGETINRYPIIAGRRADPGAADEIVVTETTAERLHLTPGDRLSLRSLAPGQADSVEQVATGDAPFGGPDLTLVVAGVVRTGQDLISASQELVPSLTTPAFARRHGTDLLEFARAASVLLDGGAAAVPAFRERVADLVGPEVDLRFESIATYSDPLDDAVEVVATGLWIFAATAALAAIVALAVVMGRQAFAGARDDRALAALGMSRRHRFAVNFGLLLVSAVVGALVGVLGAVASSPLMPVGGLARRIEPNTGLDVDLWALGFGFAGTVVVVVVVAGAVAWRESGRSDRDAARDASPVSAHVANRLALAGAAPPTVVGVRMALEAGHGRAAVPVRPALVGTVAGIAGVVAALTFGTTLGRLTSTPARYGFGWDLGVTDARAEDLRRDPDVDLIAEGLFQIPLTVDGHPVNATAIRPLQGAVFTTVVDGRPANSANEIVLGADTLDRLDRAIGDSVDATGPGGTRRMRIVGRGVFPSPGDSIPFADGAALTGTALDALGLEDFPDVYRQHLIGWRDDVDEAAATDRLARRYEVASPAPPEELQRFDQITTLPWVLAGFLGLLAILAVASALMTAVSRRRRDFAVLETLGFVGRQVSATVAWQATTVASIGIALGVPIGLIAGRWAWVPVANSLGVESDLAVPAVSLFVTAGAALLVANIVAFVPGRIAARTRPAAVLRAE